jgi:CHAD domain-containing protein
MHATATPTAASPATTALVDYLDQQINRVLVGDIAQHLGEDAIHDTRVAIRRLRSTLRVFGKALDTSEFGDMDGELRWFASLLGDVRDCQVQRNRFNEALDDVPRKLILGPVKTRIRKDLQAVERPARRRVKKAMKSARYEDMMAVLRRWSAEPPVDGAVTTDALRKRADRAQRKADRRLAAGLESGDDATLHRARKAAKRARYAAELCRPLSKPKRAKRTIKHYKHIQNLLGEHQDTTIAEEALRGMGKSAGATAGENGFTFGMLYAREQLIALRCRREIAQLNGKP